MPLLCVRHYSSLNCRGHLQFLSPPRPLRLLLPLCALCLHRHSSTAPSQSAADDHIRSGAYKQNDHSVIMRESRRSHSGLHKETNCADENGRSKVIGDIESANLLRKKERRKRHTIDEAEIDRLPPARAGTFAVSTFPSCACLLHRSTECVERACQEGWRAASRRWWRTSKK